MEFWGVEIKPGSPLKVEPEDGYVIHASQISLGETKKGVTENVPIFVKVGHQEKLLIGTLSQKFPQVSLDLFFEQEFELSHNWKNGSIFVLGYKTPDMDGHDEEIDSDCESDEEGLPMNFLSSISGPNGLSLTKDEIEKLKALSKDTEADHAELDDDEEESDADEGSDESDDEEEEETPKKVEPPSKKRSNVVAVKNIAAASKKAKTAAPQKSSGGKKNGKSKCPFPCGPSCKN